MFVQQKIRRLASGMLLSDADVDQNTKSRS